jgi:hypothetical protein
MKISNKLWRNRPFNCTHNIIGQPFKTLIPFQKFTYWHRVMVWNVQKMFWLSRRFGAYRKPGIILPLDYLCFVDHQHLLLARLKLIVKLWLFHCNVNSYLFKYFWWEEQAQNPELHKRHVHSDFGKFSPLKMH